MTNTTKVLVTSCPKEILNNQPVQITTELGWDGNWKKLITNLPLRGMAYQMIQYSEFMYCKKNGNIIFFYLRILLKTLFSSNNIIKLNTVLSNYFNKEIQVKTEINVVTNTINLKLKHNNNEQQQQIEAEKIIQNDPFIQAIIREFDGSIVPGSIHTL